LDRTREHTVGKRRERRSGQKTREPDKETAFSAEDDVGLAGPSKGTGEAVARRWRVVVRGRAVRAMARRRVVRVLTLVASLNLLAGVRVFAVPLLRSAVVCLAGVAGPGMLLALPAEPSLLVVPEGVELGLERVLLGQLLGLLRLLGVLRLLGRLRVLGVLVVVVVLGPLADEAFDEAAWAGVLLLVDDNLASARVGKGDLANARALSKDALEAGQDRKDDVADLGLCDSEERRLVGRQPVVDEGQADGANAGLGEDLDEVLRPMVRRRVRVRAVVGRRVVRLLLAGLNSYRVELKRRGRLVVLLLVMVIVVRDLKDRDVGLDRADERR
jgi:hypothetical protein